MEIQPLKKEASAVEVTASGTILGGARVTAISNLIIHDCIQRIGTVDPAKFQQIAAAQLELLAGYYQIALADSRRIFFGHWWVRELG
jgi:hypothetical protein